MEEYVYFVAKYEDGFTEAVSDPYCTKEKEMEHWREMPNNKNYVIIRVQL